ncbi:MAG: hypothetical protein HFE36_05760 [Clostridia bacterium]|nr:hypothetical protein [Clostridia bacterium]
MQNKKKTCFISKSFCFLMQEIAALVSLARNDKDIPQGIAALVALARNDMVVRHCEGTQCPRQSHTWSKKSCYTFLMAEIAALVSLARNDKDIPQGIAALVALARNDKGIPHEIASLVSLARNDNARPSLRGHAVPVAISCVIPVLFA